MRFLLSIVCVLMVVVAMAARQPFERYQSIVDKQMFGPPPPDFDPTKMPSEVAKVKAKAEEQQLAQEQEKIKKAIKFSVINVTPSGEVAVGFSDNADPKNPLHYYLKVGETTQNKIWTVKEADARQATMTIVNNEGIEVALKLGGDSTVTASAVSRAGASQGARPPSGATGGSSLFGGAGSLRERRRQREEQEREATARREAAEKERAAREEEDKRQREADREEQRKQLQLIQEELRRAREAREKAADESQAEARSE